MRLSSIDDAVEHWILDTSIFLERIRQGVWLSEQLLVSLRRALLFFACIALSFFFTPFILLAVVLGSLLIGMVSTSIRE